jgi:hypothetical protein
MAGLRLYGPWLGGSGLGLVAAVAVSMMGDYAPPRERALSDQLFVADTKLRRTLRLFDPSVFEAEPAAVGGEGLSVELELDPDELLLRFDKRNRTRLKLRRMDTFIRFGDGGFVPATARLRGAKTLRGGDKLNFAVELIRAQRFAEGVAMKKLFLMAMIHDPHQIVSLFGYRVLAGLGLYPTEVQYVRVALNGEPQGMYLLVEPPRQGLRRLYPDLVALYRRKSRGFYKIEWEKKVPAVKTSIEGLRDVRGLDQLADPLAQYAKHIDLDAYFRYLAVNTILLNQDMQAELFFYERRADSSRPDPLRLMAWDLEDIGSAAPKPDAVADRLIFSGQDRMDFHTHEKPRLRARYREVLAGLLHEELTPAVISSMLHSVRMLRDSLDDGLPESVQLQARRARAGFAAELEELLLARHAKLVRLLGSEAESARGPVRTASSRSFAIR